MAASIRNVCRRCFQRKIFPGLSKHQILPVRGFKRWVPAVNADLYRRRLLAGPEPDRHRSEWINWNYDAEIFAFGKRLGEEFEESTLRRAFIHRSYIEEEEGRRQELGIDTEAAPLGLKDNQDFINKGEEITGRYIRAYLRHVYPRLFEEGVSDVHDYLTSTPVLSHIATHIGVPDLVLCQEYPVAAETLSDTLKAVIGALAEQQGTERAECFVRDFILPQLVETDINELWKISNPMGLLSAMLEKEGLEPPEPRLQWSSAANTMMSVYYVGIYCDKKMIGKAPGETLSIAEEMAARDAIKNLLGLSDNRASIPLGSRAESLDLNYEHVNQRIADIQTGAQ